MDSNDRNGVKVGKSNDNEQNPNRMFRIQTKTMQMRNPP